MILRALYDYYHRCDNLPAFGMELKQIGFLIVIDKDGKFLRIEDIRESKNKGKNYLVLKHVPGRRGKNYIPNYLWDNSDYILGGDIENKKKQQTFINLIIRLNTSLPNNINLYAISEFYNRINYNNNIKNLQSSPLYDEILKSTLLISFRIEGEIRIAAEDEEIHEYILNDNSNPNNRICLVTGNKGPIVRLHSEITEGNEHALLVSFQKNSGYDSFGKKQGYNAPISEKAEFAYTTALNHLLRSKSHNKFSIGSRTYVFWASANKEAQQQAEESLFAMLGFAEKTDNPIENIEKVRKVFQAIYTGNIATDLNDRFYILGLAPNKGRFVIIYWSETPLKVFAGNILQHFDDMEIADTRKEKRPYTGLRDILSAVTLGGKQQDATPNLPDAIARSVFQAIPYPDTLFASCIRRIRAEQNPTPYNNPCRIAILKAYLNRKYKDNINKITVMLDKENNNPGYLCGRLFAVLDKIQEEANNINSIKERYINSASATPAAVFSTILNLSSHHAEKLTQRRKLHFEKLKQEIIDKISADGFPAHLQLQDQGRFFIGYYHQRQDFFKSKAENNE